MTTEGEVPSLNWYHRFARHPFYGEMGLNSGVMLMDLRKLRELDFTQEIIEIYREYKLNIVWGDQDLLNIYFNKHPGIKKSKFRTNSETVSLGVGLESGVVLIQEFERKSHRRDTCSQLTQLL